MIDRVVEKLGTAGVLFSAMCCAACFPALGSLAASLGLGILSSFEGILLNKLLPAFALMALILNSYLWGRNHSHMRGVLSISGPLAVLLTLYPLWNYNWSTYLFYMGLVLMLVISIVDVIKSPSVACKTRS